MTHASRLAPSLFIMALLSIAGSGTPALAAQELERPEDWQVRFDREGSDPSELHFVTMTPGWHITTGPSGILWNPSHTASGNYMLEADLHLFDPGERREAFGVFFGGGDLLEDGQAYTYFLIRRTGEFLIKGRAGVDTETMVNWTAHEAIRSWPGDPDEASVLNTLGVRMEADEAVFLVNGQEVARLGRDQVRSAGVVGLRVNHGLNLHVSRLEVSGQ
jgi:hypothetical protein